MDFKNNNESYSLTSESVTEGHPDKVCDQISDSILDKILSTDPDAKVAIETSISHGLIVLFGEITSKSKHDYEKIAKDTLLKIGYVSKISGFDYNNCKIISNIHEQSKDIEAGVSNALESRNLKNISDKYNQQGAGDQGIVFGFACSETDSLLPLPIYLAHKLTKRLAFIRHENITDFLLPDGKAQVTIQYYSGIPKSIENIIISTQHKEHVQQKTLEQIMRKEVIDKVIPEKLLKNSPNLSINITPSGKFVKGGPEADAGLTGRKIIVDTYGGSAKHGGGAFSGKDPSKVDRSGAYMARYIAKNLVAAKLVSKIEIQISYGIGMANPISIYAECFNTNTVSQQKINEIIHKCFDCRPAAIIENFNLKKPMYAQLAAYGHFGREELNLPWEKLNKIEEIIQATT
jgi:S-adenosylmethionine synthetase